jgi:hypothetical protein
MPRAIKDLLVRDDHGVRISQWLPAAGIKRLAGVGSAGHDHADAVPAVKSICGGPKLDLHLVRPFALRGNLISPQSCKI